MPCRLLTAISASSLSAGLASTGTLHSATLRRTRRSRTSTQRPAVARSPGRARRTHHRCSSNRRHRKHRRVRRHRRSRWLRLSAPSPQSYWLSPNGEKFGSKIEKIVHRKVHFISFSLASPAFSPTMCRKIICATCSKPTWAGCGQHIDSALSGVAESDRCATWKTKSGCAGSGATAGATATGAAAETKTQQACKD